ncbi:MAG: thioredoxin [Candidatus Bipolaricaulota bacterium]|nr:thioredoxin [Candidatus Bipolaricaulota bacterium]MBS3791414.1 thioredoxin [Candidatus Bipolaricaulota bacterium]
MTAKRTYFLTVAITLAIIVFLSFTLGAAEGETVLYFFWSEGCPYCQKEKPFLEDLQEDYPSLEVVDKEVSSSEENVELLMEMGQKYGREIRGVPATFLGEEVWVGFTEKIGDQIKEKVEYCTENDCVNPLVKLKGEEAVSETPATKEGETIDVPFFGTVDLSSTPAFLSTALIAFVDGFNPCSLWVLTFLLGMLIYTKSRKKIVIVGLTFLAVTATAYGLFILGLFSAFQYIGQLLWIRILVAVIAFSFGLVNIKDYFWFKEGISFTISDGLKPKIADRFRNLTQKGRSLPALVGATFLMALGITLAELPCTAGFPVVWTGILNTQGVSGATFGILFAIYMAIYLLDELLVFGTVSITLQSSKLQEEHGRVLKLIGGALMLTLGVSFLFAPELMTDFKGSLIVFGAAVLVSVTLVLLRKTVLPAIGS